MNKRQLLVARIAVGLIVLIGLVPPWTQSFQIRGISQIREAAGYAPIFAPPKPRFRDEDYVVEMNIARLFLQWILVAVAGGTLIWTLKTEKVG
jgi:hypothetical protein